MIGELMRNEADIGGTALFFTSDRVDIIDYISMTTPTRSKFVFREPKLSYVTNVFTLPFDDNVWASTIALVILMWLVLFIILKWEWAKKKHSQEPEPYTAPELHDSSSSTSIQTLEDLLKSRLQVGVDDTVFNRFYFPNSTEPIRRAIYLQKVKPLGKKENFMTMEEGVRKMREGLFAFHMETGPGYKLVGEIFRESEKCGLKEIQYLQVSDPWLAIQKNSSYKEFLKIG
ncbi:unnamed protein product [Phaedon cochleariae]|uniref:Ionotropic receptor n=1 Tax=Phaedon cochleariae TaxID=80249 RepID=A0A9N9S8P5_PHACE|nr:unnamed protein product [Phaedon cochleariae]